MRVSAKSEPTRLSGQLLIAMPAMADPNFARSVSLICEHNEMGALGVVINHPMAMSVEEILDQFGLRTDDALVAGQPVFAGGPVQPERGFVIHDGAVDFEQTLRIHDGLAVTTSRDVLERLAEGHGPAHSLVALGYAGWGPGQLEQELAENAWISAPADPAVVFQIAPERRWQAAAALLGVDVNLLSAEAGHA